MDGKTSAYKRGEMVEAIRAALLLAERQGDWKTATELLLILRSMR